MSKTKLGFIASTRDAPKFVRVWAGIPATALGGDHGNMRATSRTTKSTTQGFERGRGSGGASKALSIWRCGKPGHRCDKWENSPLYYNDILVFDEVSSVLLVRTRDQNVENAAWFHRQYTAWFHRHGKVTKRQVRKESTTTTGEDN